MVRICAHLFVVFLVLGMFLVRLGFILIRFGLCWLVVDRLVCVGKVFGNVGQGFGAL